MPTAEGAPPEDAHLHALRLAVLSLVRTDRDLSLRQLGILLVVTDDAGPRTVRGLAADLSIPRPSVCRSLDVLVERGLAIRRPDPADGRSIVVAATPLGTGMVLGLAAEMAGVALAVPGGRVPLA